jgi:glycosyltransferase involved in cell wall biosynthesis
MRRRTPGNRLTGAWKAWQHRSYSPDELDRCLEVVREFKPDLVHFHGTENFFGLISEKLNAPSVLSIQAVLNGLHPFLLSDLGWRDLLGRLATREFILGAGPIHKWLVSGRYRAVEQRILESCHNYIGRTQWDKAMLMAFNPKANYYPCDEVMADIFYSVAWKAEAAEPATIYSTTSNAFFKGSLTLAQAVGILKKRGWNQIRLQLGGLHPKSNMGRQIAKFTAELHLKENIFMLGTLSPQQIVEAMLHAKVYVLPSHMDNSPNSLCEAMLMGMPCVAAHVGGVPSLVREGQDGLLYHDRDPYMLADRIAQVLGDPPLAARLGEQARRTAQIRHDRQSIAARTVEIYQGILASQA